jgi:hypothetical protein
LPATVCWTVWASFDRQPSLQGLRKRCSQQPRLVVPPSPAEAVTSSCHASHPAQRSHSQSRPSVARTPACAASRAGCAHYSSSVALAAPHPAAAAATATVSADSVRACAAWLGCHSFSREGSHPTADVVPLSLAALPRPSSSCPLEPLMHPPARVSPPRELAPLCLARPAEPAMAQPLPPQEMSGQAPRWGLPATRTG